MKSQKYFAELLGTFFLGFAVSLSLVVDLPIPTPVIAGLTLMVMVYTIGAISGAQINPAVSISLSCVNKQK